MIDKIEANWLGLVLLFAVVCGGIAPFAEAIGPVPAPIVGLVAIAAIMIGIIVLLPRPNRRKASTI